MQKRATYKRIICMLMAAVMLVSTLPVTAFAATVLYNANSNPTTITVSDTSGNRVTGATVTVTRSSDTHEVVEGTNGQYYFSRKSTSRYITYNITVSASGYETKTATMRGNSSRATVTLTRIPTEFADFNVYYIADGQVPNTGYQGSNDAIYYGPSANNTPLVVISVDIAKLREIASQPNSPVVYDERNTAQNYWLASGNQYEFVPQGTPDDADFKEKISAFWGAVLTCVTEESIEAFKETGLFENYMAYCLKKQNDGSQHSDGILNVKPPVYVVELYQNDVYFGGGVTDTEFNTTFLTAYDILDQYEAHLKQTITWAENEYGKPKLNENNEYTGTYVDPETNRIHNIAVFQFNVGTTVEVEGSEIPYTKQADTYYLAQYNMRVDAGTPIKYLVTYTDGANGTAFSEHEYAAERNDVVPAFTGAAIREDYDFIGWYLEGDTTSTVYSDADIANMTVTKNMTFHAVWQAVPKYTGTVKVVVNGTYDAASQTLLTGTLTDIEVPLNLAENTDIYLSTDGQSYILMDHNAEGTYSKVLKSGVYYTYYNNGNDYVKISDQPLIMDNMDRTRYLFYNTVFYDLNGGTLDGSTENVLKYFPSGDRATVDVNDPVREGYRFAGWKTNDGRLLNKGDVIAEAIDRAYTVTAQWIKLADVYVNVVIDHYAKDGDSYNTDKAKHNVSFTVDSRESEDEDYTEKAKYQIIWDGKSDYTGDDYDYSYLTINGQDKTVYTALKPMLTDVSASDSYTATSNKSGYMVTQTWQETDENGDIQVYLVLKYDPNEFDFEYTVVLDDEAKALGSGLWPKAVNVKVTSYENGKWLPIMEHGSTYERVEIGANGEGKGYYPVWIESTDTNAQKYYYRIEVVSYELQDGSIVLAENVGNANTNYDAVNKAFLSRVEITGGKDPDTSDAEALHGVWYDTQGQVGTAKAIVSIPVYTVTFIPNGGTLNGSYSNIVLEDQIVMPNVESYVPVRDGGYIFEGWYTYEDGHMTDHFAVSGSALTKDVTLIAKWRDPIKVEGTVTVAATYEQTNEDGSVSIQYIHSVDRTTSVTVVLQKKTPTGYFETVDYRRVSVDYSNSYYYFQKTDELLVPVGVGWYAFAGLKDDGTEYRVVVLSSNYTSAYQNEPESVNNWKKYDTYTNDDYLALLGEYDSKTATVNAHLHFAPPSFDLLYQVDATAIGDGFAPTQVEVAVTYDSDPAIYQPWLWPVISQMVTNGAVKGNQHTLTNKLANGVCSVWNYFYDGVTLYDYGISLIGENDENPYYTIEYQAPAHFVSSTGGQNQLLIARYVPKTYNINYVTNGGTITGIYTKTHTWSFETKLSNVVPVREGYQFMGWYKDEALTQPLDTDVIDASVAQDTTFYAKWLQVMDKVTLSVTIDHSTAENDANAYDFEKDLTVTLARREENTQTDFIQVADQTKTYTSGMWHTSKDDIETLTDELVFGGLSSEFDYNLFAELEGYYIDPEKSSVTKVENADGSATHNVVIYLKFSPELLELDFTVELDENLHKALYPLYADVKVTCWYPDIIRTGEYSWKTIMQHESKVVDVEIDQEEGFGTGSYPVWQWEDKQNQIPYYYRIEVVSLELSGGTVLHLNEIESETVYANGGYTATVYAENGCKAPSDKTSFEGAYGSVNQDGSYSQTGTLRAVISAPAVVFHANNEDALCYDEDYDIDVFRTYLPSGKLAPMGEYYNMTEEGKINPFYDIPEFEYNTHNGYVFKGWYTAPDSTGKAIDWSEVYTKNTDIYAHWIKVENVTKEAEDTKQTGSDIYAGFDLVGAQIRNAALDNMAHYGNPASGLRFITVLSENVYEQINAITGNENGAEYGFAVAKTESANKMQTGNGYEIEYNANNVNGVDTTYDYRYVRNMKCSGVVDHFDGEAYRLFTAVITYNGLEGDALESAYATPFVARSYIRYYDANGLYRTYYNNYTGTQLYSSMNTSFAQIREIVEG